MSKEFNIIGKIVEYNDGFNNTKQGMIVDKYLSSETIGSHPNVRERNISRYIIKDNNNTIRHVNVECINKIIDDDNDNKEHI